MHDMKIFSVGSSLECTRKENCFFILLQGIQWIILWDKTDKIFTGFQSAWTSFTNYIWQKMAKWSWYLWQRTLYNSGNTSLLKYLLRYTNINKLIYVIYVYILLQAYKIKIYELMFYNGSTICYYDIKILPNWVLYIFIYNSKLTKKIFMR